MCSNNTGNLFIITNMRLFDARQLLLEQSNNFIMTKNRASTLEFQRELAIIRSTRAGRTTARTKTAPFFFSKSMTQIIARLCDSSK